MLDLEWKLIYVGSADSEKFDQVLDSVLVGPIAPGTYKFVFEADAPDPKNIPVDDIVGVTVVLLTCSYKDQEFVRVGYYVNNDYPDEETRENPPEIPQIDKLQRNILADKPRVTTFQINFDQENDPQVVPPGFEATNSQSIRKSDDMDVDSAIQQQHQHIQQQQQFPQLNNSAQQQQPPFQNGYITETYEQNDIMEADGTSHQQQQQQQFEVEF